MKKTSLFFSLLLALSLLVVGCGEPPECKADNDCFSSSNCLVPTCTQGACQTLPKPDCCGNTICEDSETVCSCNQDCKMESTESGACEGPVKVEKEFFPGSYDEMKYAQYYCLEGECEVGVPDDEIEVKQLISSNLYGDILFDVVTSISQPYVAGEGVAAVKITLNDIKDDTSLPMDITSIQAILDGQLVAEELVDLKITKIGASVDKALQFDLPISKVEQISTLVVKIKYGYTKQVYDYTLQSYVPDYVRTSIENSYYKLYFVDPEKAP